MGPDIGLSCRVSADPDSLALVILLVDLHKGSYLYYS